MFVGTMPLDHLQISLEVQHGYFGAAAFAFLVMYVLVILFLSRTQYRTPFYVEFCCHFKKGRNKQGTLTDKIQFPCPRLSMVGFSLRFLYNNSKFVLQPLNGGFLYNDAVLLDHR